MDQKPLHPKAHLKHPITDCRNCELSYRPYVPSYAPELMQYPIYWIGQAPGQTETFTRQPFTGSAGKTHWSVMKSVGLNRDLMPHINIVNCWPEEDREPMINEIRSCKKRLTDELHGKFWADDVKDYIQLQPPKLIVALGEVAMRTLTGLTGITSQRGSFVSLKEEYNSDCKVLCSFHPSYCQRRRQFIPVQSNTYKLAIDYLQGTIKDEVDPNLILDPPAEQLEAYLNTTDPVACDTETTGLNHRKSSIIGFSFAKSSDEALAVVFRDPSDPRWPVIRHFLENPNRKKIWQNGSFDTGMIRYSETNPFKINDEGFFYDTRLAEQMINSELPTSLDYLRGKYTKIRPYKPQKSEIAQIATWGKEKTLRYAALDAVTTFAVYENQHEDLTDKELSLIENHLIPLVYAIGRMQNRGVLVDVGALSALISQITEGLQEPERRFAELGLNPRSPKQIKGQFGLKKTDVNELTRQINRNHPDSEIFEMILEYRTYSKLRSTYLVAIYNRLEDGRIHTSFKIEGTGTGRLSSENPNLQNVPEIMRIIYIPDPGYQLIKADYASQELWVGAILAEEDDMLDDLMSGRDIHYIACQLCFPDTPLTYGTRKKDFTHRQAWISKRVTFGVFYGRTARSIALEFGVTVVEAEGWQMRLLQRYPKLRNYKRQCEEALRSKGYVETPFGRKRYITSVNQAYNAPVQSTASDITLGSIVRADQAGLELLISVHDDILYQVPIDKFDEQLDMIQKIQERPIPELQNISFKCEYETGMNWYELENIDMKNRKAKNGDS